MKHPSSEFDLSRLRDIGWTLWDPIGLSGADKDWCGKPFEDEYDRYLVQVALMLKQGDSQAQVVEYLFGIQSAHMGLVAKGREMAVRNKLKAVVQAIVVAGLS